VILHAPIIGAARRIVSGGRGTSDSLPLGAVTDQLAEKIAGMYKMVGTILNAYNEPVLSR
jgi:electron transfer flavoprotein alpha subunit